MNPALRNKLVLGVLVLLLLALWPLVGVLLLVVLGLVAWGVHRLRLRRRVNH
ncbi:MAG TPA: hypothetical protein VMV23_00880 [Candidatus Nanopelagicaceae bacterium]|nr:hypothetical protein [Candidatus Nanopelagicaceae bacterium]